MKLDPTDVYETNREGGLVALQPYLSGDTLYWTDFSHRRAADIDRVTKDTDTEFAWVDKQGRPGYLRSITPAAARRLSGALKVEDGPLAPDELKRRIRAALSY